MFTKYDCIEMVLIAFTAGGLTFLAIGAMYGN